MDILRKEIKRYEAVKKVFDEWADNKGQVKTEADQFKYLISELSVGYNVDLTGFEKENENEGEIDWEKFKSLILGFIHKNKPVNVEKTIIRVVNEIEKVALNDLFSAGIEFVLVERMKKKLFNFKSDSWVSHYFKTYTKEVMFILNSFDSEQTGEIQAGQLLPLLKSLLTAFNLKLTDKDIFLFKRMIENRYKLQKSESNQSNYSKVSFFNCIQLIEEWAIKESYKYINVNEQVARTILEYQTLIKSIKNPPELSETINNLIQNLKGLGVKTTEKPAKKKQELKDLQLKGLKEIFDFYARQIKMVGQHPSFSEINNHQSVLNLSKFTKFCSDFCLLSNLKDKYKLQLSFLSNIFLKATNCKREMNFTDFLASFDYLADYYYNDQYDQYFNEQLSTLSIEEKRKRLLLLLKCEDQKSYSMRLKGFGLAFSLEKKGFRLPDNDISKKYKFKDQSKIKQKIENWKNQKKEVLQPVRSSSVPSHARLKAIQQSLLARPDRVTWDLLNKNLNLITKDDLSKLLEAEDIKELIRGGIKL